MGTECQLDFSDEDSKMLDEAEERGVVIPECFQEVTPEVERAIEERFDQMMEEKNSEFVEKAEAIIEKDEMILPERIPAETLEEKELIKEIVEQEIKSLQPVRTMPEERKAIIEAGKELGLPPRVYVNTADIVRFPKENIKEVMTVLHHPEMPKVFIKRQNIGQVQYVNRPDLYALTRIGAIAKKTSIFVLPDEKGQVPTGKLLRRRISHDIVHPNWFLIREYIQKHKDEFDKATAAQLEKKGLPPYPVKELNRITEERLKTEKGERPPLTDEEKAYIEHRLQKETVGDWNGYYFTDRSQLVPEAQRVIEEMLKYFREEY